MAALSVPTAPGAAPPKAQTLRTSELGQAQAQRVAGSDAAGETRCLP